MFGKLGHWYTENQLRPKLMASSLQQTRVVDVSAAVESSIVLKKNSES